MSTLGAFRVKKDIIDQECDLVFVEYAVNDADLESKLRMETREGLVRQLLENDNCDVVFVYTYIQTMYEDMVADKIPQTIADFEKIADYYNISSVWMGLHAMNKVREGVLRWEEWLPDGLHPNVGGSRFYAEPVMDFVIKELNLYLDTHKDDIEAFEMLKSYIALSTKYRNEYVRKYGPL